jgi:hypothetical protein
MCLSPLPTQTHAKKSLWPALLKFSEDVDAGISYPRYMFDIIPGMNAIAFTREVRARARLEGWPQARC